MKKTVETVVAAVICLIIIIACIRFASDVFGGAGSDVEVAIPDGASGSQVISVLDDAGIIKHPTIFKMLSTITGKSSLYRSGVFMVNTGDSYLSLIKTLTSAPNSASNSVSITIPEGFNVSQIANALEKAGITSANDFLAAASKTDYDFDFIKNIKNADSRKFPLEGYLFPDTYSFSKNTSAETVVKTMLSNFENVIKGYSIENIDDTIILASIIEKEALGESDRKKVSSVFHNRLKRKDYLSRLQSCATVQYILGESKAVLSEADTKIDSPYNTYIVKGLPLGPISNPGEASIEAAINPENTEYLYFGLNGNGVHAFSKTYDEHLRAIR